MSLIDRSIRPVLWVLLAVFIFIAASTSMVTRWTNENKNRTILTVADYEQYSEISDLSGVTTEKTLKDLKNAGVHAIGVKELSLRELATKGDIMISEYGSFIGNEMLFDPTTATLIKKAVEGTTVTRYSLVVATDNANTAEFLHDRLSLRLTNQELTEVSNDNISFFIIHTALSPLNANVNGDKELDMRLGFDEELLSELANKGFDIVLRPGATSGSNQSYRSSYADVIKRFNVKVVLFSNTVLKATPDDIDFFANLCEQYQLTVGIIEASNQILYLKQDGIDDLMEKINYSVNRAYSTTADDYCKKPSDRYYRWVRAVVDRGLRIMYTQPFIDKTKTSSVNLKDTLDVISNFHTTMSSKGFDIQGDIPILDPTLPTSMNRILIAFSLALGCILYLSYLVPLKNKTILLLASIGILGSIGINFIGMDFTKLYALGAAILYPTLSGLLVLIYLKTHKSANWIAKTVLCFLLILTVNALGMITLVSSLSDLRYIMYVKTFSGVKVAFMTPLLLFMINYLIVFYRGKGVANTIMRLLQNHPTYLVLGIGCLLLVAVYVYLGRSGSNSGITVLNAELRLREILEMLFLARPRFKEIIIGYPCIAMMVYLYHRYRLPILLLPLGLGMMMGSISMTNTFCHVFASIQISSSRTLSGILVGIFTGIAATIFVIILERIILHFYPGLKKHIIK